MNKKKVVIVMPELFFGGAETQFRYIIKRINKELFEIYVIVEHSNGGKSDESVKRFLKENPEVSFRFLKGLSTQGGRLSRYLTYIKGNCFIYKIIRKIKPDFAIIYSRVALKSIFCFYRLGILTVYSERNVWANPDKFWNENRTFLKKSFKVVCNSIDAKEIFKHYGMGAKYIPNGIEVRDFLPYEKHERYMIVVPARITREKNQEIVIRALAQLKDKDICVRFVGVKEDDDYYELLINLAKELCVDKRIFFSNYTANQEEIYKSADLVVLPSLVEGLSNVILESYMFGRLCILSDISQNRNAGSPNQRYFLPHNYMDLAKEITYYNELSDVENRRIIEENHKFVINNYSVEKMVQEYENIICNCLSK